MSEVKYLKEAKDFVSGNASSWYVSETFVGKTHSISMTFVNYVHKVHLSATGGMAGQSDLVTEALATVTLDEESAKAFALAILQRVGPTSEITE